MGTGETGTGTLWPLHGGYTLTSFGSRQFRFILPSLHSGFPLSSTIQANIVV